MTAADGTKSARISKYVKSKPSDRPVSSRGTIEKELCEGLEAEAIGNSLRSSEI